MRPEDILGRVRPILHDPDGVRWPDPECLLYIADAQQQIVEVKPTANSTTGAHELVAGEATQPVPENAAQMMRVSRNLGLGGDQPGRSIVMTSLAALDAMDRGWRSRSAREIELWAYDPDGDRNLFWVYPAPDVAIQVEASWSVRPSPSVNMGEDLELDDRYINPMVNWVLYRCFLKDAEHGGNQQVAEGYLSAFAVALGAKVETIMRTNPNRQRRGGETDGQV